MKKLTLFFVFIFSIFNIFCGEDASSRGKAYIYKIRNSENVLILSKSIKTGSVLYQNGWVDAYLKDSFISDDIFRKECEGEIDFPLYGKKGSIGSYDAYSPFFTREHNSFSSNLDKFYYSFLDITCSRVNLIYPKLFFNEVVGYKKPGWNLSSWEYIDYEFSHQKRTLILFPDYYQKLYESNESSKKLYANGLAEGKFIEMNFNDYKALLKAKKSSHYLQKPYFNKEIQTSCRWKSWKKEKVELLKKLMVQSSIDFNADKDYTRFPIMCIDPDSHAERVDKEDWSVECFLNKNNGDFYQYFFFEKELDYEWPLYIRDWAMDFLAGVNQCKKSTVGVTLDSKAKMITYSAQKTFDPKKIVLALDDSKKPWRPSSLPVDKNTIPEDRLFHKDQPGRIFGSSAKVWELDIWFRIGQMLKTNPQGIYLVGYGALLQAEETKTPAEEAAFVKAHGVLITPDLYKHLNALREKPSIF